MASIMMLPTFTDDRGCLSIIEKLSNFEIKRVYYIYNTDGKERGGHRHIKTRQLLICVEGSCDVFCENENKIDTFKLDSPKKSLLVEPEDWHTMQNFSKDCVLLVLASEYFDKNDYIEEKYYD